MLKSRNIAIAILLLGVVAFALGIFFVAQGVTKSNQLTTAMLQEQVMLPLQPDEEPSLVDTAEEAQAAGDLIREHRRGIAPTYQDLLGGGHYDPTNPAQLSYAQAMNMENYLYLAVLGFGLTDMALGNGVFMIIVGLALGGSGILLYRSYPT